MFKISCILTILLLFLITACKTKGSTAPHNMAQREQIANSQNDPDSLSVRK